MLDKHIIPVIKPVLAKIAAAVGGRTNPGSSNDSSQIEKKTDRRSTVTSVKSGLSADQVSFIGFILGMVSIFCIIIDKPLAGLVFLLLNRLADGIDGELARRTQPTDAGGFLDISLDFIFYALFPLGFAIADPANNALPAAILIASFVGTGASFLAYSSMSTKYGVIHPEFSYKGFYYLNGIAEGTETIICFVLMCLFPQGFVWIASAFAAICMLTAFNRVVFGYRTLRRLESRNP